MCAQPSELARRTARPLKVFVQGPENTTLSYVTPRKLVVDGVRIGHGSGIESGSKNGMKILGVMLRRMHRDDDATAMMANYAST